MATSANAAMQLAPKVLELHSPQLTSHLYAPMELHWGVGTKKPIGANMINVRGSGSRGGGGGANPESSREDGRHTNSWAGSSNFYTMVGACADMER